MKNKKIAVVMGGPSAEREVSLNTGKAILSALIDKGYNAVGLDLHPSCFISKLKEDNIEVVFNAVHGLYGEDGVIQGTLELLGIPYTGSGLMASAMAMDKGISKRLFLSAGIPTPRSVLYTNRDFSPGLAQRVLAEFALPVVVKAAAQGSSIGVAIVNSADDLSAAITDAFKYSGHILIEEFIKGRELTVPVWENDGVKALPVIEIRPHSGRYDYQAKYTKGATEYLVPAELDEKAAALVKKAAVDAFEVLGCRGIARVDIMLSEDNKPYVLEVNTIPGMTATSLVPKSAAAAGIGFSDLCEQLLLLAK